MINTNFYNQHCKYKLSSPNKITNNQKILTKDYISFKGHFGVEKYEKDDIKYLKHETGFFRDIETKEFVKNYIEKNFANKDKIKILIGACSTGEEAYTYAMLLDNLKSKTQIVGFDLSETSIKEAKSKKFLMQKQVKAPKGLIDAYVYLGNTLNDSYLCFPHTKQLSEKEIEKKKLFENFFEISTDTQKNKKTHFGKKINQWIMKNILKMFPPTFENKYVVAKENTFSNCEFTQGNILKLKEITKDEKADVITFSNALYHITTEEIGLTGIREQKNDAEKIIEKLIQQIKENLKINGLFVIGEDEISQMFDSGELNKMMIKNGFEPLNKTDEHLANIWKLK